MSIAKSQVISAVAIAALLISVVVVISSLLYMGKMNQTRSDGPLDVSDWEKVDKEVATGGGFILSGSAINYGNGRPYKLHLKNESDGSRTWYAEMIDNGEWYKTTIGKR
jgi:hypothetical protein